MDTQERNDTYMTLKAPSEGLYKEKGSKFLAFAYPVASEEEIKQHLERIRKEYYDARHHCYAYRLGLEGNVWRANDDGEPSSTAGRPIYGQILSHELSDVLIVVVRYFGGIKLGVPGLINAYRSAAADAIEHGRIVEKVASEPFAVTFGYSVTDKVMRIIKDMGTSPGRYTADNVCRIEMEVRLKDIKRFTQRMEEAGATVEHL
ncbi:MAG TPA: YigZ family protein [Candidatus Coprenecus stercoravium]|uniref:YigZ family protein n=1 Tax=Candidatus Coprenecus stercoravium TaxID=2840735 RepID=A0A9D2KAS4_9BACT|nr:YigZ family protein [Candidatus Coprenecus stercoravium]